VPTEPGHAPGPHPPPPSDLDRRSLPLKPAEGPWFRSHRSDKEPLFFGRLARYRFDAPDRSFGVLYVAEDPHGAFIETFSRDLDGYGLVDWVELERRSLSQVETQQPLQLVDLTGAGLARLGADNRLATGAHSISRSWSAALYHHPRSPDGIAYRCRHDPGRVGVAVFDRSSHLLSTKNLGRFSESGLRDTLRELLDTYELGLVGGPPMHFHR